MVDRNRFAAQTPLCLTGNGIFADAYPPQDADLQSAPGNLQSAIDNRQSNPIAPKTLQLAAAIARGEMPQSAANEHSPDSRRQVAALAVAVARVDAEMARLMALLCGQCRPAAYSQLAIIVDDSILRGHDLACEAFHAANGGAL